MKRQFAGPIKSRGVFEGRHAGVVLAAAILWVVGLVLLSAGASAIAEPQPVGTESLDEVKPAMDGDWVVYYRGNDLLAKNLADGRTLTLASGTVNRYQGDPSPAISGNRVVWQDYRNDDGTGQRAKIYYVDLPDATARRVDAAGFDTVRQTNPDVAGDLVVWEDNRFAAVPMVYIHNLSSSVTWYGIAPGATDRVDPSQGALLQLDPAISISGADAWAAWRDRRQGNFDLYAKNLAKGLNPSTNPSHRLSSEPADVGPPDMGAGRYAAWTADVDEPTDLDLCYTDIVLQTTLGQSPKCLNSPGRQESPVLTPDGNRIYWQDWRNGDPLSDLNADIYMLMRTEGKEFNLTGYSGANQKNPAASGMRYAWQDRSAGNYDVLWDHAAIMINSGLRYTKDCRVSVQIFPPTPGGSAELSNDQLVWKPLIGSDWLIPCGSQGSKTVHARFGLSSPIYSDEIYLDVTPPSGAVVINNGDTSTTSQTVNLALTANDIGSGVTEMRIAGSEAELDTARWVPYVGAYSWTLAGGPGEKAVYAQFRDGAGNLSAPAADSISYVQASSATPPVVGGAPGGTTLSGPSAYVPGATGSALSPPTTTTTAPKVLADATKPVISRFSAGPNPFSARGRQVKAVVYVPVVYSGLTILQPKTKISWITGTTFFFTLSERARVIVQINQLVVPTKKVLVKRKVRVKGKVRLVNRWVTVKGRAKWTRMVAFGPYLKKKGAGSLAWNGRVKGKVLAPGAYQAVIQAKDLAGNVSAPRAFLLRVGK